MEIHHSGLGDVQRYIDTHQHLRLEDKQAGFDNLLRYLRAIKEIGPETKMLEIGTGTGWFPLLCKLNGLQCKGLEISPALIEYACLLGKQYGIQPDIELGNLEQTDLGTERYDVIIANSVFEHVEHWRQGLAVVFRALKSRGALFFESTNKFSLTSGEWPAFPVYGWLPDGARYHVRQWVHGKDIMKLGIDFNQFRYGLLRRTFREIGFREVHDRVELTNPATKHGLKRAVYSACQRVPALKTAFLCFAETTTFVCIK